LATNRFSIHHLFEAYDDVCFTRNGCLDLQVTHSSLIIAATHEIETTRRPGEVNKLIIKLMEVELEESEETERVKSGDID
jgi:hypothetical protein